MSKQGYSVNNQYFNPRREWGKLDVSERLPTDNVIDENAREVYIDDVSNFGSSRPPTPVATPRARTVMTSKKQLRLLVVVFIVVLLFVILPTSTEEEKNEIFEAFGEKKVPREPEKP